MDGQITLPVPLLVLIIGSIGAALALGAKVVIQSLRGRNGVEPSVLLARVSALELRVTAIEAQRDRGRQR